MRAQSSSSTSRGAVVPRISSKAVVDDLGVPRQRCCADPRGLIGHLGRLVARRIDQPALVRVGHCVEQDQVAEPVEQIGGEAAWVVAGLDHTVHRAVDGCGIAGRERVDHVVEQRGVGDTEQGHRPGVGDPLRIRTGEQLVEYGERVTRGAAAGADDEWQHRRLDRDALGEDRSPRGARASRRAG